MDCSPLDSSVHGDSPARILEWVAMPSSRGSSWPVYGCRKWGIRKFHSIPLRWKPRIWTFIVWLPEKAMATHSSTLSWEIPWMEEPGRLQSMGLRRVGQDWATSLSLFTFMHWRRKWQPSPVFLPAECWGWEPGGLLSMGSHRVGHNWRDLAAVAAVWLQSPCY